MAQYIDPTSSSVSWQKLVNNTKTLALGRGDQAPTWTDIWATIARMPEFHSVFYIQNIDRSGFLHDLNFIEKFARDTLRDDGGSWTMKDIREATQELQEDLKHFKKPSNDDIDELTGYVLDTMSGILTDKMAAGDKNATPDKNELKIRILADLANHAIPSIALRDETKADMAQTIVDLMIQKLQHRAGWGFELDGNALEILETMLPDKNNPYDELSPAEVFSTALEASGDAYEVLLQRNGLRSTGDDLEDTFKDILPETAISELMLHALQIAYDRNDSDLNTRHVALALLQDYKVKSHLNKIGLDLGENAQDFEDNLTLKLFGKKDSTKNKIAVHPEIGPHIMGLVSKLNAAYTKEPRLEEVLRFLLTYDDDVADAFKSAGLTDAQIDTWADKYKKLPKDDAPKKHEPQKVSDDELNALIAEYCTDYTQLAKKKKFDPMIGNNGLTEQISTILLKRGKKNPVIVGEAGIGKTKAMEGLAQAIVAGDVPEKLLGARLLMLDLHKMNDSPYAGVFESRIKPLLDGISQRNAERTDPPILLGVDEIAEAQDAGGHQHSPGFKGFIKPYLTTGDIFLLGATTLDEYRSKMEKDPALARRLQPVYMTTPSDAETAEILKGLVSRYEDHHGVKVPPAVLDLIAIKAGRYIHTVNQPDKSIDLLDEALAHAQKQGLAALTQEHVLRVIASKTNIPYSHLSEDDSALYNNLAESLSSRVFGQSQAVKVVAGALKRAKAGFKTNPKGPVGNFLFVGPTGVGKTELAKAIAHYVMGNEEEFLVRFDMSEFSEKHTVSKLIGSPPGYVGYDEGGGLVKSARSKPFAVYLYDEFEKAHPDVFNILLAPLSDGVVTDGRGISADLRHTVNIFTGNIGAQEVMEEGQRLKLDPVQDHEKWQQMALPIYKSAVENYFKPEFLNRMDGVIYFESLTPDIMNQLVLRQEERTKAQLQEKYHLSLDIAEDFRKAAAKEGFDVRYGARPLARAWQNAVETPLADWLLMQTKPALEKAKTVQMLPANGNKTSPQLKLKR